MLLFIDSFDHYTDLSKKYDLTGGGGVDAANARGGSGGCYKGGGAPGSFSAAKYLVTPGTTTQRNVAVGVMGLALKTTGSSAISPSSYMAFNDGGTNQVAVWNDGSGHLQVKRNGTVLATSTNTIPAGWWIYIEFKAKIDGAAGEIEVRVNGSSVGWIPHTTGLNTQASANAYFNRAQVGGSSGSSSAVDYIDDVYVLDCGTAPNTDFLGDCHVQALVPNGAGTHADMTRGGADTGANYSQCSEHPPDDDTTYVASATPGAIDSYGMANPSSVTSVYGVQVSVYADKDDLSGRTMQTYLLSNGAAATSADYPMVQTTYKYYQNVHDTNPDGGGAWSVAAVNALEAGVKVTA